MPDHRALSQQSLNMSCVPSIRGLGLPNGALQWLPHLGNCRRRRQRSSLPSPSSLAVKANIGTVQGLDVLAAAVVGIFVAAVAVAVVVVGPVQAPALGLGLGLVVVLGSRWW